ncbi:hypothetical protein V6N11_002327 [Hibiscus sabdariffa]|uniref:Translocation protein SEC62 n=2 Tax=Hibiscus sabdariffa TaxID=183260 RepID=A0ABR1Z6L4_9ROSI
MKKSGGAEKKKARRSSASVQNVSRDPGSDTPPRKQAAKKDVFQLFAEKKFSLNKCSLKMMHFLHGRALLLILSLLLLRAAIFGAVWIILGKRVWFFPNILAEEATLRELFRFWPKKDEEERAKLTSRLFFAIVAMLVILLLRHHAPNEAARARYQKRMSNIIDDVLEWSPSLALSGMMEKQTVFNATENNNFSNESNETSESETVTSADEAESLGESERENDSI